MDNQITGHDDNVSWDGRKTADFEKISNDGLWAWDGVEWQPRKITKRKFCSIYLNKSEKFRQV